MFDERAGKKANSDFCEENRDLFSELPKEISHYLSLFLDARSLGRISQVNKRRYAQFKEPLVQVQARKLLKEVMNGNPKGVEKLLKNSSSQNESIVLQKVQGTEENGREWRGGVSALEFAAWAGDTEIVNMLLDAVPKKEKSKALSQLEGVQKGTEHGAQMSAYASLTESYDEYIAKFDSWDWPTREDYWVHKVGMNQLMLPLVGLQWMCDKEAFDPVPSFKSSPERSCKLYDNSSLLPLSSSGLASRFALYKGVVGAVRWAALARRARYAHGAVIDVGAYRRLCEVKKTELAKIIDQLHNPSPETESQENNNHSCVIS